MVAFFLFPSALADQRQLYQAGFMAPYSSTYAAVAAPQMYAPVAPEMMYAPEVQPLGREKPEATRIDAHGALAGGIVVAE